MSTPDQPDGDGLSDLPRVPAAAFDFLDGWISANISLLGSEEVWIRRAMTPDQSG